MGDKGRHAVLWIALTATTVQLLAGVDGRPEGMGRDAVPMIGLAVLALALPVNLAAIVVLSAQIRDCRAPNLVTATIAGLSLAWHGYALVLELGRPFSTAYRLTQAAVFGFVFSVLSRYQLAGSANE